ncbi:MAG TPA: hypothetical protein VHC22_12985 [Pirellulales bacterium]|nr:hypothetical protein [Pirellulales bacterium]
MAVIAKDMSTRGRQAVLWGLGLFIALQIALGVAADCWFPALRYPEYGRKLALLQRIQQEQGSSPALLALGTSRVAFGFCPAAGDTPGARAAAWQFNFALTGQGPLQELVCLHRLLAAGIRPERLLIEINPPLLHQAWPYCEPGLTDVGRLAWADVRVLARYMVERNQLYADWFRSRVAPWYTHRRHLLGHLVPALLTPLERSDIELTRQTDAHGWSQFPVRPTDEANRRVMEEWSVKLYAEYVRQFEVSDAPARAIREIIEVCRREGIEPALLLMPECESFRQGYPEAAQASIDHWLEGVRHDWSIAVFDCRTWSADDQFCDGHHLLPEGAEHFSARFEEAALHPWLRQGNPRWAAEVARVPSVK